LRPVDRREQKPAKAPLSPVPALAIIGAAFAVVAPFLILGNPSGHDFEFHVLSWMEVVNQWKQGIFFPRWAEFAHWTYGEARFLFYPPASWTLGALIGAILPWKMAPGAFVWCALAASGGSMFFLARQWLCRNDAIFAAILYAVNPYHIVVIYWRSALAELLAGCLLPLLLLVILRAQKEGGQMLLPLSLIVAAAWLINAPAAVMVNYSLALLVVIVAVVRKQPRLILYGVAAILLGAGLAGFYLIPAAYEEKWVNIGEVLAPGLRPQDNFLFTLTSDPDHNRFNLVVSVVGAAEVLFFVIAAYVARKRCELERTSWWAITLWGAAAALLMLPVTRIFWNYLPKLRFVQLPWRWLLCLNVSFAILLTVACKRWLVRALVCAAMLGVLWTAWHRVQPPWWDTAADVQELHDFIEDGGGYEGTDEYVPAGIDPSEIDKNAPQVSTVSGGPVRVHIQKWTAQQKEFTTETSDLQQLRLRLFNYPAWRVEIDGKTGMANSRPETGEVVVPVGPGTHHVRVLFGQTPDRLIGGATSALALMFVVLLVLFDKRRNQALT